MQTIIMSYNMTTNTILMNYNITMVTISNDYNHDGSQCECDYLIVNNGYNDYIL